MSSVIILSDTHGNTAQINKIDGVLGSADVILHAGDGARDIAKYNNSIYVQGNCDGFIGDKEKTVDIDGVRILLTHGHTYGVKQGLDKLIFRAQEVNVKYVVYGHTHISDIVEVSGITLINPGSLFSSASGYISYGYASTYNGKMLTKIVKIY